MEANPMTVSPHTYVLYMEAGSEWRSLSLLDSNDDFEFETTDEAIDFLPETGNVHLKVFNTYYFGRLGENPVADILFSEQSALRAMRNSGEDPDNELSRSLEHYLKQLHEKAEPRMLIDAITETGVRTIFCACWTGMFLEHVLLLSGGAVRVKEFAHKIAV